MAIIKAREFILRPIRITDVQGYFECHKDEDSKANFSSVPTTIEEAKKELQETNKHNKKFAIIIKEKFAGFINLKLTTHPRYKHSAIVGYGIHKDFR